MGMYQEFEDIQYLHDWKLSWMINKNMIRFTKVVYKKNANNN